MALGVPADKIVTFPQTRDTANEIKTAAAYLTKNQSLVNDKPHLIIVSSATHLLRASIMATHQGIHYTMAPTDFLAGNSPWYRASSTTLNKLDRAVHEWVGILWFTLRTN